MIASPSLAPSDAPQRALQRFLGRSITVLRWSVLAALLLLMLAQPTPSRIGLPSWSLLLLFAAYNLGISLLLTTRPRWMSFARVAILDLLVAALLYVLGGEAGGPLFVLFFLAVDSAAASLTLRGILVYTFLAALLATASDVFVLTAVPSAADVRLLGVRLIGLAVVGIGMTILTRRLALEHSAAQAAHTEASRLEAEAGRLTELEQLRADFIASVSHDLRTPLSAARAALILLDSSARERHSPDEQALLANARRNIERLDLLIGDLLTSNQLDAGTLQLDRAPIDLHAVVRSAMAVVEPLLQQKGQVSDVDVPLPLTVEGDERRLEQVLVNVLANAHMHTPAGTRIAVRGTRMQDNMVALVVSDNGPGVPPNEYDAIFQRFYRRATDASGSGLGLAIARAIVDLHGGRMWAERAPAGGTAICMTLPSTQGGQRS